MKSAVILFSVNSNSAISTFLNLTVQFFSGTNLKATFFQNFYVHASQNNSMTEFDKTGITEILFMHENNSRF